MAAEMGQESAQENVAFALEKGYGRSLFTGMNNASTEDTERRINELKLRYWVRSAAQDNVDAMVKVGDLFYNHAGINSSVSTEQAYERAIAYYRTAADTQTSSMAYWNLGYMHERGKGVARDWHLAKRYYDLSAEVGEEGWAAVMLSLVGLYFRRYVGAVLVAVSALP